MHSSCSARDPCWGEGHRDKCDNSPPAFPHCTAWPHHPCSYSGLENLPCHLPILFPHTLSTTSASLVVSSDREIYNHFLMGLLQSLHHLSSIYNTLLAGLSSAIKKKKNLALTYAPETHATNTHNFFQKTRERPFPHPRSPLFAPLPKENYYPDF